MIMKYIAILFLSLIVYGCTDNKQVALQNSNAAAQPRSENIESVAAHTTENQNPPMSNVNSPTKSSWSQGGDPIDTSKLDEEIKKAEATLIESRRSGPGIQKDQSQASVHVKEAEASLSKALFNRAVALTEARQYAAALGDYRKSFKLDPSNDEAKKWIDQIVLIYGTLKKAYPKEGEEPPPLPYEK